MKITEEQIRERAKKHSDDPTYQDSYITGFYHGLSQDSTIEKVKELLEEMERVSNNYRVVDGNYVITKIDFDSCIEELNAIIEAK